MATSGHESETINVSGLKATMKDAGNIGLFNEATCSTAAGTAAKEVTKPTSFTLTTGATIVVKFTNAITVASATLNVGSTGAKAIYYRGAALAANRVAAGDRLILKYNGTQFDIIGHLDTDTNTQAVSSVVGQTGAVTATQIGTALTNAGYKLTDNNTWNAASTSQAGYVPAATKGKFLHSNASSGNLEWVDDNNTTYSSQAAASGGTAVSLCTTGEKYTWNNKQAALVSGTNIKTINNTSILGSGNIEIQGGGVLEIVSASGTTLTAEVGKYYRYNSDVTTLAVTLPTITGATEVQEFVLDFSTSSSTSVTFTGGTIKNANSLSIIANHTYVIRLVWNGDEWIANTEVDSSGYRNIEYLESTGTQYIDTGLKANGSTTRVEMTIGTIAGKRWSFGTRTAFENKMFLFTNGGTRGETPNGGIWFYHNGYTVATITNDNATHTIIIATNSYFDHIAFTRTAATFTTDSTMIMFGYRDGNTIYKHYMKIYSCKIYDGATLLRDYVPVRLGQVGYMYDKVSGNYFSNQGTGSFVLGPDI